LGGRPLDGALNSNYENKKKKAPTSRRTPKFAELMEPQDAILNEVSDETGQFDPRFILWRKFCAEQDIPVDSLPGNLTGEVKEQWEKLKAGRLGSTSAKRN
jgi:hypothetical protein